MNNKYIGSTAELVSMIDTFLGNGQYFGTGISRLGTEYTFEWDADNLLFTIREHGEEVFLYQPHNGWMQNTILDDDLCCAIEALEDVINEAA
ncbi:hypothetical protein D3C78_1451250 [compost metagenome]